MNAFESIIRAFYWRQGRSSSLVVVFLAWLQRGLVEASCTYDPTEGTLPERLLFEGLVVLCEVISENKGRGQSRMDQLQKIPSATMIAGWMAFTFPSKATMSKGGTPESQGENGKCLISKNFPVKKEELYSFPFLYFLR